MPEQNLPLDEDNGWGEWRKHVLITQQECKVGLKEVSKIQGQMWQSISSVQKESAAEFAKLRIEILDRVEKKDRELFTDLKDVKSTVNSIKVDMASKEEVQGIKIDVSNLKLKAGVWGLIAGLIPAVTVLLWWVAQNVLTKLVPPPIP